MDAVEEVKSRLSIEDVIGEYVILKRSGRNWRGLSPFTNEKSPSFMVSPEKQIWHDFSSNKGGNMFSFVMEMEGLDFRGALELLARKAGINLDDYGNRGSRERTQLKNKLSEVLEISAKFYQLHFTKNQQALEYILKTRLLSKATALEWKIGFSPQSGAALVKFLRGKGFSDSEIKQAGLASGSYQRGRDLRDMFRGRIMIPLQDSFGSVIGFTARLLEDDKSMPKYINTPQTLLYDKSRHVYGLHLAKEAIRRNNYAVLVEGNLDVISAHQAGTRQVVATAGTALTQYHLKSISRFSGDIRLCFDGDKAGLAATERAIPIAAQTGVALSVIRLGNAKDPDDLIRSDPSKWEKAIEQPVYAIDWLMKYYEDQLDLSSSQGKKKFSDIILVSVSNLADQVEREHYIQKIAKLLSVSPEALLSKLQSNSAPAQMKKRKPSEIKVVDEDVVEMTKTQNHFLAISLLQPRLRDFLLLLKPDMLYDSDARELLKYLRQNPDFAGDVNVVTQLQPIADYVKILLLQYETLYQDIDILELRYEASRLLARLIEQYVKNQKRELVNQMQNANDKEADELLGKVKNLDNLLKQVKEA
jgi:DNA primase